MPLQALEIDFAPQAPPPPGWSARLQPLAMPFIAAVALGALWWLVRD